MAHCGSGRQTKGPTLALDGTPGGPLGTSFAALGGAQVVTRSSSSTHPPSRLGASTKQTSWSQAGSARAWSSHGGRRISRWGSPHRGHFISKIACPERTSLMTSASRRLQPVQRTWVCMSALIPHTSPRTRGARPGLVVTAEYAIAGNDCHWKRFVLLRMTSARETTFTLKRLSRGRRSGGDQAR